MSNSLSAPAFSRLTARDYKTLWLATLGGVLEFYDFTSSSSSRTRSVTCFSLRGFQTGFGSSRRSEFLRPAILLDRWVAS